MTAPATRRSGAVVLGLTVTLCLALAVSGCCKFSGAASATQPARVPVFQEVHDPGLMMTSVRVFNETGHRLSFILMHDGGRVAKRVVLPPGGFQGWLLSPGSYRYEAKELKRIQTDLPEQGRKLFKKQHRYEWHFYPKSAK